jgi:hypothetical protein
MIEGMNTCTIDLTSLIIFISIAGIFMIAIGVFQNTDIIYGISIVVVMYTLLFIQFLIRM